MVHLQHKCICMHITCIHVHVHAYVYVHTHTRMYTDCDNCHAIACADARRHLHHNPTFATKWCGKWLQPNRYTVLAIMTQNKDLED